MSRKNSNPKVEKAYYEMGIENEKKYKPVIENLLGYVVKTSYKFCIIDFYGYNYRLELKSRSCSSTQYKDTMIGYNKYEEGLRLLKEKRLTTPDYKLYFAFAFTDGLFIWELTEENFIANGGESQVREGGTDKRGYDDYKIHLYIFMENLKKIDETPCYVNHIVAETTGFKTTGFKTTGFKSSIPEGVCLLKMKK